jgi:hypothetical protein
MKAVAIGYLRSDISGSAQNWDEIRIRSLAKRYGYDLAKTVVFTAGIQNPISQLIDAARRAQAEAVITPRRDHLGLAVPEHLVRRCDVITVDDQTTFARSYVVGDEFLALRAVPGAKAWLAELDSDDQAQAVAEIRDAAELAIESRNPAPVHEVLQAWATTVAVLRDAARRAVHIGSPDESEFVEARAPRSSDEI